MTGPKGITCYERDEMLCDNPLCLAAGCRIKNSNDEQSMTQPDKAALAFNHILDPISYLRGIRDGNIDPTMENLRGALDAWLRSTDGMRETVEFPKTIFTHPSATAEGDKAAVPIISNVRTDGMREVLADIARQHKTDEMDEAQVDNADFENAYDIIIGRARAALAAPSAKDKP